MDRTRAHHQRRDLRQTKLAQLFAEAKKRGIDPDELRNVIAPGVIGHRLSEAKTGEIIEVIRHIGGNVSSNGSNSLNGSNGLNGLNGEYKDRFSDLGYRDGMATPGQLRKIEAMWMGVSKMPIHAAREKALNGFLKRITGVENLRFLEDWMVRKVITAIEHMKPRPR